MDCERMVFSGHALKRMFEGAIDGDDVRAVVVGGDTIAAYPNDAPHPSALLLGWAQGRPLHVVVARDPETGHCVVVTTYVPDPGLWEQGYRRRRRP